ncbi:hypothetical protein JOF29_007248 [Kribbella aluminosa]|uniref:SGNH hydrolase-type esterase N-terminal domain-containing protein n=1 Tax=Kribbella aluminosa TaxID=416017 RepID=A0ABS4UWZ5_9ACTN|nr:hypothetical protein [Kribbella aluminosa]
MLKAAGVSGAGLIAAGRLDGASAAVPSGTGALAPGAEPAIDGDVVWYDVAGWGVEGKGWSDTNGFYDRLPARAEAMVRPPVWSLSRQSAGMAARFETDSTRFDVRYRLSSSRIAMPHMPATGVS